MTSFLNWKNINLGRKYTIIFSLMASAFILAIFVTFLFLNHTGDTMDETVVKNEVAIHSADLITLFHEKYILIPEYLLMAEDEKLTEYLAFSQSFAETAKELMPNLPDEQLDMFYQMIENNHELDQYFFSVVVPNVQQINTDEFTDIQASVHELKEDTTRIGEELKTSAVTFNQDAMDAAQGDLRDVMFILIFSTAVAITISFVFLFIMSRSIKKNLNKIVVRSQQIADGQLNNEALEYDGKDEIGQLSLSMNHMGKSLRDMISQVSEVSELVDKQSVQLLHSSEEVREGSDQVAVTIEELANGATSQADNATVISESTKDFSHDIDEATGHSDTLVAFSKQVLDVSIKGNQDMEESLTQMSRVNEVVKSSVTKVKSLESKTHSITEIVDVIKSIAEQTNLLALNASIEAARAGEAGKGFAVVATEVRKLAEEVTHSVENITGIVLSIKTETASIAEELNVGYTEVSKGTEVIERTGIQFGDIKNKVEEMSDRVIGISTIFKKVAQSSKDINESVENIAAVSEESAAGSEEISATVVEQSQAVETIADSAKQLTAKVEEMNNMIKRFEL
ncbi:HAMP domain-containing methyl-accepting chemotaxis protein [Salipaludibacillus sp. LMS25]|uniref:methyl-accepting chemotaxis protein n=1 Tax=Salipaludibacillus sp. LMS25 TaxID=2924031 RepID=UPI0020D05483|nr:HAMP domain-containing methyl-accepting chemotaxis protein [Salipaludibacillus sp. LMS25]UTR13586.1 HAMP domain-containing methyl-accepting chemotaxis protein [Salipaludibacillus sp. LMS25]